MFKDSLPRFLLIAFLEGCSYLLFALTMPLKYKMNLPQPNYVVGMIHGILFIAYVVLLLMVWRQHKWSFKKVALSFIASLIPFGTFLATKKIYNAKF